MTRMPVFEDFGTGGAAAVSAGLPGYADIGGGPGVDGQPSAEFEKGYNAGWADAAQSSQEEQAHIRAELAHNLRDIGFTHYEARVHVLRALEPLLSEIIDKVFPELVRDTLAQHILQASLPLATELVEAPLEIVVAPAARAGVEPVLAAISQADFVVRDEPTLGEGQVILRAGKRELSLNPGETLDQIRTALSALSEINKEMLRHG